MTRSGFLSGVGVAAVLALLASVGQAAMVPIMGWAGFFELIIPVLGLGYVLYLFSRSPERVGRVTTLVLWLLVAAAARLFELPPFLYLATHITAIWLIRSLYFYASLLAALTDLGLSALSAATAYWAALHTGSGFMAVWCFFLMQALFAAIPPDFERRNNCQPESSTERFEQALHRAEAALRQCLAQ